MQIFLAGPGSGRHFPDQSFGGEKLGLKGGARLVGADDRHQIPLLEAELGAGVGFQAVIAQYPHHGNAGFFANLGATDGAILEATEGANADPLQVELLLGGAALLVPALIWLFRVFKLSTGPASSE